MSVLVLDYTFSTAQVEPPTSSQVRLNDSLYPNVTKAWIRNVTNDGADMHQVLLATPIAADVYVQDKNDSTTFARFRLTAAPIGKVSYVELPVTYVAQGSANLLNNQAVMVILITAPAPATSTPPGEDTPVLDFAHVSIVAPLVSLVTVKQQLRIRDDLHDADINEKLATAQERILAHLAYAADPLWTEATVPKAVAHAILLLTTHYYEHRGDDMTPSGAGGTPDADVWAAIDRLLAVYHDPTLA